MRPLLVRRHREGCQGGGCLGSARARAPFTSRSGSCPNDCSLDSSRGASRRPAATCVLAPFTLFSRRPSSTTFVKQLSDSEGDCNVPHIEVIRPTDQPTGRRRLLAELRNSLEDDAFIESYWSIAFARLGPLTKLQSSIESFRHRGGRLEVIVGIDHFGTSHEALELAAGVTDRLAIVHAPGRFRATFHPKVYIFTGPHEALFILGSHNLTPGGLETNLEASILIRLDRQAETALYDELMSLWTESNSLAVEVDRVKLAELTRAGLLRSEAARQRSGGEGGYVPEPPPGLSFHFLEPFYSPPEPLKKPEPRRRHEAPGERRTLPTFAGLGARGLIIQIVPHPNGEVFLSKIAVGQDPAFFGHPFTGWSQPKRESNQPYPQREPDPLVDLNVYDDSGQRIAMLPNYRLNMVDYTRKDEIRITVHQPVAALIPALSILVMQEAEDEHLDYRMDIYAPGSHEYQDLLHHCNQRMPSGGARVARRFGWF